MRLSIPVRDGAAVREDSLVNEVGRVLAVVENSPGDVHLVVDLEDDKISARLAELRGAF